MTHVVKEDSQWANPAALGLAGFGLNTILLQVHNLGLINSTLPIIYGFFWGGIGQIIAGLIDARRGDTFGLTAFTSYGLFWLGISFAFLLEWMWFVTLDGPGLAWLCICWGIFTGYMTIGTFKISRIHIFVFASLTLLFFLLAANFYGVLTAIVPGIVGIICGGFAVYGSAAVVLSTKYGKWVFPIGLFSK